MRTEAVRQRLTAAHLAQGWAADAETIAGQEAVPSAFEVERAKHVYIPLLVASYALANDLPVVIPAGYRILGEIRTGQEAMAETSDALEVQQALAVDAAALEAAVASPDAFGFVVQETQTGAALVCLRGTQTPREWAANFTAIPNPFSLARSFGLVHLGFERLHRRLRNAITRGLTTVPTGSRISVIGHSLGGALAMLAAVDLNHNFNWPTVDVCTFGAPRVGKFVFRHRFDRAIPVCYRVTNQGDIVPGVPLRLTGWRHAGEEIEVAGTGDNAHSLAAYLDGLRNIGLVREIALPGPGAESLLGVMSLRTS